MTIFVINGAGGVGKDSFVRLFTGIAGEPFVLNVSTVDGVKNIAKQLGWSGEKTPEDRKALSDLKDMLTLWNDFPFNDTLQTIEKQIAEWKYYGVNLDKCFCFIHCREPKEIERFVKEINAITILITRQTDEKYINHADLEVENYNYDLTIENNRGLEDLMEIAEVLYRRCCDANRETNST